MLAMTELHSVSLRPVPDDHSHQQDDTISTAHRSVIPTDYHDLSPLDALAAQGRLLTKRLTQNGKNKSSSSSSSGSRSPPEIPRDLDESVFPKFGVSDTLEDRLYVNTRRHRIPEKRKEESEKPKSPRSPAADSLSLTTISLRAIPQPVKNADPVELSRSESQASSQLSLSTSSDGSSTPTETYLATRIYQPPPKLDSPKLRPIIKTQHLNHRPHSPALSPTSKDQITPIDQSTSHPFSPRIANSLDRPRLPSLQTSVLKTGRTPSINFSRPYSSRSSAYSDASSMYEVDYFSTQKISPSTDDRLSVPNRSPGTTDSVASSPGLVEEDYKKLPRGRRKSRPVEDTGVFFHSTSIHRPDSAYRWPQTPVTPTNEGERKFFPSPGSEKSVPGRSIRSTSTIDVPPVPRPSTSGSIVETPKIRINRSLSHEARRPSPSSRPRAQSSPKPRYTLQPPASQEMFSSPTQVLNSSRRVTMSLTPIPAESRSAEDHVTLGIGFHQEDLLPQATHHFQLAAEAGSPTGMLFYSLSLRHGWGCAANPEKAVEWLHLAAECASAEVDENGVRRPGGANALALKSEDGKRGGATLALAIYELGQSYMHGWGVQKDKHLALRCYEISANFGDTDGQWYSPS